MIEQHEKNRHFWNEVTPVHVRSSMYDVEGFLAGRPALDAIELSAFGDVTGKSLLHLQCHFGQSTLDWARRGAQATGVDFSTASIEQARALAVQMNLQERTTFILCDVLELGQHLNEQFDYVFASYGAICWLSDLRQWGRVVAAHLKPGGTFFIADVHPSAMIFDERDGKLEQIFDYFAPATGIEGEPGRWPDYADPTYFATHGTREWQWTIADVVESLLAAGLTIAALKEYESCCFRMFPRLCERADGLWYFPKGELRLPMTFSVTATR